MQLYCMMLIRLVLGRFKYISLKKWIWKDSSRDSFGLSSESLEKIRVEIRKALKIFDL